MSGGFDRNGGSLEISCQIWDIALGLRRRKDSRCAQDPGDLIGVQAA
jgi:hypothetical protein